MTRRRAAVALVAALALAAPVVLLEQDVAAHSCQGRESGGKPHKQHKRGTDPRHACNDETTTTTPPVPPPPVPPPSTTSTTVSVPLVLIPPVVVERQPPVAVPVVPDYAG